MKKKIAFIMIFIVFIVGLCVWYVLRTSETEIYNQTTDRAREFVLTQQKQGSQEWVGKNIDATGTPSRSQLDIPGCFSLEIGYPIQFSRQDKENECNVFLKLKGGLEMTLYKKKISYVSIDDDSGVLLRRRNPDLYREEKIRVHDFDYLIFTKLDSSPEITTLSQRGKTLFVMNLIGSSSKGDREKFNTMLESLIFYNE